ncbi:gliding motility-associated C-terminal domain-containing protein [Dysgonomonas sp. 520]|uniref:T9SS type B sorting domain-containing protein n=1 Tax=Dysgonomonas sp. 520 TaxID=2302931 RepID=UPI0013D0CAFB|nr:gliding motility-associated C-terminal domain-containing protein [Dysgonomonas sp. 520]NDW09463.1 gliding motility-associated C-terminal domain-containing protein [Dysgonomonas sp. 520]
MKRLLFIFFVTLFCHSAMAQQFEATGGIGVPHRETPKGSTGITAIYFFNTLNGAKITYTEINSGARFYKYKQNKESERTPIPESDIERDSFNGSITIHNLEDSYGYWAEGVGMSQKVLWIIDYTQHLPQFNSITPVESGDKCEYLKLLIDKSDKLIYYTTGGIPTEIERKYTISYTDLSWKETNLAFLEETRTKDITIEPEVNITAPLKNTNFTITGDQYAGYLGMDKQTFTSELYQAQATEAHIEAVWHEEESGEQNIDAGDKDQYPTPARFSFYGHTNEPVVEWFKWEVFNKNDMHNWIVSYTDKDMSYTFDREGDFVIAFTVGRYGDQSCKYSDSVYVSISDTKLEVPNFFTPDDSPGVNDEFKVAYRSITKFKCTIFNSWGNKLYEWTDPSKGWDGKYKGKLVNTGAYYYVIEYTDSRGKKRHKAGDVNILRMKK